MKRLKRRLVYFVAVSILTTLISSCGGGNKEAEAPAKNDEVKDTTPVTRTGTILFFGNSLTAGYGLDISEAFPALIQHKIDSLKLPYKTVNAGLSGETSAGGKTRIGWLLQQPVDVFVLELGANDGLRGIAVKETVKNLQDIIDSVKIAYPSAKLVIAGMQIPPNMGATYTNEFKGIFGDLAQKNNMTLIPFILEGVGGVRELNQQDGIHPTAEGAKIVAGNVWAALKNLLH